MGSYLQPSTLCMRRMWTRSEKRDRTWQKCYLIYKKASCNLQDPAHGVNLVAAAKPLLVKGSARWSSRLAMGPCMAAAKAYAPTQ
jgi:hypothetical protein